MRKNQPVFVTWSLDRVARPWVGAALHRQLTELERTESGYFRRALPQESRCVTRTCVIERLKLTRVRAALASVLVAPTSEAVAALYRVVTLEQLISSVDQLCTDADIELLLDDPRAHAVGRFLAQEAPQLAAVAFGIVLLGQSRSAEDRSLLLELGSHEPLTSCVAEVLAAQGTAAVFSLAQRARGKARCAAVEWLADAEQPEICAWLLREGALDAEHHHHVAYLCASTGRLSEALAAEQVDDALMAGASQLLQLLASSVSAPDMADYDDAPAAIASFLRHSERRALTEQHLRTLQALADCPDVRPELAAACGRRLAAGFQHEP